jgi:hypothetical protein
VNADQILARTPNLTYRQLDLWCSRGYLRPANQSAGSGRRRSFSGDEVRVVQMMATLVQADLLPRTAEKVARAVLALPSGEPATVELAPGVILVVGQPDRAQVPA